MGRTSRIATGRRDAALGAGTCAVIDDTVSRRFLRDRLQGVVAARGARLTLLCLDTPFAEIHARRAANALRPTRHAVADAVFAAHLASFEPPGPDEGAVTLRTVGDADRCCVGLPAGA